METSTPKISDLIAEQKRIDAEHKQRAAELAARIAAVHDLRAPLGRFLDGRRRAKMHVVGATNCLRRQRDAEATIERIVTEMIAGETSSDCSAGDHLHALGQNGNLTPFRDTLVFGLVGRLERFIADKSKEVDELGRAAIEYAQSHGLAHELPEDLGGPKPAPAKPIVEPPAPIRGRISYAKEIRPAASSPTQ
jgi:hypothetical protein